HLIFPFHKTNGERGCFRRAPLPQLVPQLFKGLVLGKPSRVRVRFYPENPRDFLLAFLKTLPPLLWALSRETWPVFDEPLRGCIRNTGVDEGPSTYSPTNYGRDSVSHPNIPETRGEAFGLSFHGVGRLAG